MSSLQIQGNASGAAVFTLAAPGTATNRTLTLPDATDTIAGIAATQTLTNKTLTTPNINSAQISTVSGTAPLYMARAWVNFNGTGTPAIRASGNMSSITDNGTGDYTINFTTAMADVNFSGTVSGSGGVNGQHCPVFLGSPGSNDTTSHPTASAFRFSFYNVTNSGLRVDQTMINAVIFR